MSDYLSDSDSSSDAQSIVEMPLPYDPADYPEYILRRPTEEELEAMEDAREPALCDPLRRGLTLAWDGPNRHPESLPLADYPPATTPDPSPHSPRPLVQQLVAPDSPAHGGQGWSLRLVEAVQAGAEKWSQVWRCKIVDGSGKMLSETVILKLYQQSLFPLPNLEASSPEYDGWNWYPASHLEKREAEAYSLLKVYQGRDLPVCYGFHRFRAPCGEEVVGVVLEDLLDITETLPDLAIREDYNKRFDMVTLDKLMTACFDVQYRLQNRKIQRTATSVSNILVVSQSWPADPRTIIVGFSKCRHADLDRETSELFAARYHLQKRYVPLRPYWPREYDQSCLFAFFGHLVTDSPVGAKDWEEMEKRRKKLPYIGPVHGWWRREEWEEEVEQWERERALMREGERAEST
ncbi:hypothetical protein Rhopal_004192-T1 [Rhodotorula paludigena]|uniref:Uncharacterized protein n=1 Tax=Rhodotorula paludigena TaxID=86838 RepID=A0AAV5GPJ6_9BASI|nr:hypothetical protein Rhopal_004192-T1 [Rhodotorula paludigena]